MRRDSKHKRQSTLGEFDEFKGLVEHFDKISPLLKKLPKFKEEK